jgi:membrane fusion protein (multidrug efflux system)
MLAALSAQNGSASGSLPSSVTLENCYVSQIEEVQVPAQEGGVLTEVAVKEGDAIRQGQQIGQIDDVEPRMQRQVAEVELKVAQEEAQNDINVRYSKASADVSKAEYDQAIEANRRLPGTVPQAEVRRLQLKWREAVLSIEQAEMRQRVAALEAQVAKAKVDASNVGIERRKIIAPVDALVLKLYHHAGEWVKPGDPVVHIIQLNRLWVEGFVKAQEVSPSEINGRPVSVDVLLARGRKATFTGQVVFVKPVIEGGTYQIRAEVENRQENGFWLLTPGMPAVMTINIR